MQTKGLLQVILCLCHVLYHILDTELTNWISLKFAAFYTWKLHEHFKSTHSKSQLINQISSVFLLIRYAILNLYSYKVGWNSLRFYAVI